MPVVVWAPESVEGTACTVVRQASVNCVRAIRAAGTAGGGGGGAAAAAAGGVG